MTLAAALLFLVHLLATGAFKLNSLRANSLLSATAQYGDSQTLFAIAKDVQTFVKHYNRVIKDDKGPPITWDDIVVTAGCSATVWGCPSHLQEVVGGDRTEFAVGRLQMNDVDLWLRNMVVKSPKVNPALKCKGPCEKCFDDDSDSKVMFCESNDDAQRCYSKPKKSKDLEGELPSCEGGWTMKREKCESCNSMFSDHFAAVRGAELGCKADDQNCMPQQLNYDVEAFRGDPYWKIRNKCWEGCKGQEDATCEGPSTNKVETIHFTKGGSVVSAAAGAGLNFNTLGAELALTFKKALVDQTPEHRGHANRYDKSSDIYLKKEKDGKYKLWQDKNDLVCLCAVAQRKKSNHRHQGGSFQQNDDFDKDTLCSDRSKETLGVYTPWEQNRTQSFNRCINLKGLNDYSFSSNKPLDQRQLLREEEVQHSVTIYKHYECSSTKPDEADNLIRSKKREADDLIITKKSVLAEIKKNRPKSS